MDEAVEDLGMAPNVLPVTREELLRRRSSLLARTDLSEAELHERADTGSLTTEEWDILTELGHVDFLLGK